MKKASFVLLVVVVVGEFATAASALAEGYALDLAERRNGTDHDALLDIDFSGSSGIAVGDFGALVATSDAGETWTLQSEDKYLPLTSVAVAGTRAVAVGLMGGIVRSDDFTANNWDVVAHSATTERLLSVEMHESGLVVAVGGFGVILVSNDFGKQWRALTLNWSSYNSEGLEPHLYGISITSEKTILIGGELGLILRSDDAGASWSSIRSGDESVFAIRVNDAGEGYAVGQNGLLLFTEDGGMNWIEESTGVSANLFDVWFDDDNVTAVGMRTLIHRMKGESHWRHSTNIISKTSWFQAIGATKGRTFVVGQQGRISELVRLNNQTQAFDWRSSEREIATLEKLVN